MSVLVTRGAGFIGSHIASSLLEEGHTVNVIDVMDPYYNLGIKERNIEHCREIGGDRYTFVEGSITDEALVDDHEIDYIYHEAAQAGVRTSVENPKKSHEINTTGLLNLLIAADTTSNGSSTPLPRRSTAKWSISRTTKTTRTSHRVPTA